MKEMSVKKIVLCSIAAFSALMLFIGLCFPVVSLSIAGESASESIANGFELLAFEFPQVMRLFFVAFVEESYISTYEIVLAISSLLTLLLSIAFFAVIILALFRFSYKKNQKIILSYFISASVIAIANLVIAIIVNANMNACFEELGNPLYYKCTTTSYLSLIFLVLFFVGYFVCKKLIPEKAMEERGSANTKNTDEKSVKKNVVVEQLKQETAMIAVIREYKKLVDQEVISASDYVYVKSKLLSPINKRSAHCEEKEQLIIHLLRDYQQLYADEIITSPEFIEKKAELIAL